MKYVNKIILAIVAIVLMGSRSSQAQTLYAYNNWCQVGGQTVNFNGLNSNTTVQASYPLCTVTVFISGTSTLATIYADSSHTVQGNPFSANFDASFNFFAAGGVQYDVVISGAGMPQPHTFHAICLACVVSSGGGCTVDCVVTDPISDQTIIQPPSTSFTVRTNGTSSSSNVVFAAGPGTAGSIAKIMLNADGDIDQQTKYGAINIEAGVHTNAPGAAMNLSADQAINLESYFGSGINLSSDQGAMNTNSFGATNFTSGASMNLDSGQDTSINSNLGNVNINADLTMNLSGTALSLGFNSYNFSNAPPSGTCSRGLSLDSSNNIVTTSCSMPGGSFYQFIQNSGTSLPQQGNLNLITPTGIVGANNSVNGSTDVSLVGVPNSSLANSSVTITPGTGLVGGGTISLGGSATLSTSTSVPLLGINNTFSGLQTFSNILITGSCSGCGGGVTQIIAGSNVTLSPVGGTGVVTISATNTSSVAWSALTAGTNTANAFLIGAGSSLGATGGGTITATAMPYSGLTGSVPTWNQNTTGSAATLTNSRTLAGNSFNGSANVPFANNFIVQGTTDPGLTGAQFMGALATGLVKNTTSTGVLSIATAGTDYLTPTGSATGLSKASAVAFGVAECDNTTITCSGGVFASVGSSSWSALINPSGNLGLTMAARTTTFTFNATTGTSDMFKWVDTASNTGTGILAHFTTASASTEIPWQADANGVGWKVTTAGVLQSTDTLNNTQDIWSTGSGTDTTCVLNTTSNSFTNCIKAGIPQVSIGPSGPYVPYLTGTYPWSCQPGNGDGLNVIVAGTYPQTGCYNDTGHTITLTGIKCFSDNNGSSTLAATNGAGTALLTGAVTCTTAFAAGTQSGTVTIAAGDFIKFSFVADGTTKQSTFVVTGTHP